MAGKDTALPTKLLRLLNPLERRQLLLLTPAVIFMALMETLGVASIVPFLKLLSDPAAIEGDGILPGLYRWTGFSDRNSFFFAFGVAVLAVLTIGNSVSAVTTWALMRFSWMRTHSLSTRLLGTYLRKPYAYFLARNTSELSQKILAEVQQVVGGVIVNGMLLCARSVVVALVLATLLLIDPLMAVAVGGLFGGLYGGLFWLVKRKLRRLGEARVDADHHRFRIASEMLGGVKEVKVLGLERTLLGAYETPSKTFAASVSTARVLAIVPRYALETVAFGGILLMVLLLLYRGSPLDDVLPSLGLYAFAAYRLIPSLQQAFAGIANIRANLPALDLISEDLDSAEGDGGDGEEDATPPLEFESEVRLAEVSFRYDGADVPALRAVTLAIEKGSWVALVGPTGSGKSTLVDLLLCLLAPTTGAISVDGTALTGGRARRWQQNVGYVPQQIFLIDDSIARNIAFGVRGPIDLERVREAARVAQIDAFIADELPEGYDTRVGERGVRLSGGQRQRIGIARALYRRPKLLVMDEATSALDGATEASFFRDLRSHLSECTVVSIAHRLTTTRGFDQIYVVDKGAIADVGTFDELRGRSVHFASVRSSAS